MDTHPNQNSSALFIIIAYTILGVLVGTLLVFGVTLIINIINDRLIDTLPDTLALLPLFLLFGAILGGVPALLTGMAVAYSKRLNHRNIPAIILQPAVISFVISLLCALVVCLSYLHALEALTTSAIFACVGGFSGFVVSRFIK